MEKQLITVLIPDLPAHIEMTLYGVGRGTRFIGDDISGMRVHNYNTSR